MTVKKKVLRSTPPIPDIKLSKDRGAVAAYFIGCSAMGILSGCMERRSSTQFENDCTSSSVYLSEDDMDEVVRNALKVGYRLYKGWKGIVERETATDKLNKIAEES